MRSLPLYDNPNQTPLELAKPAPVDKSCQKCFLGTYTRGRVCMSAEFVAGADPSLPTVLIVAEGPTLDEARAGRPHSGDGGRTLRKLLQKHYAGNVVLDNVIRCGRTEKQMDSAAPATACMGYLKGVLEESGADRIIILGHQAAKHVLGRSVPVHDARKNYTWIKNTAGKDIPVFVVYDPASARIATNRHMQRWFTEDLVWALKTDDLMPPLNDAEFHIVETVADAELAVEALREHDWLAYDCETAGRPFSKFFDIKSYSVSPAEGDTAYVWGRYATGRPEIMAPLLKLMADPTVGKVGANEKYDRLVTRARYDVIVSGFVLDVQLSRHLEFPGCLIGLEVLAEMVGMGDYYPNFKPRLDASGATVSKARTKSNGNRQMRLLDEDPVLVAAIENPQDDVKAYSYALIPTPHLERYNACDTIATARAARSRFGFSLIAKHAPSKNIWRNVVKNATETVEQIEAWGMPVSRDGIQLFRQRVNLDLAEVEQRFKPYGIKNLNSHPEVSALLFDKLRLSNPHDKTGKSRAADKAALNAMKGQHPVVSDLIDFRKLEKLRSAYASLDQHIRTDGRIHPSFKIDGAATGRMSCTDPGLHQIPRAGSELGKILKNCFAVGPGRKLVQLDQSQLEYRVAAILSGDTVMRDMFLTGMDFHLSTAKMISRVMWGVGPDDVTKEHRDVSKTFNFGLMYGMGDNTIANNLKISALEAAELRKTIMGKWVDLATFIAECEAHTRKYGNAHTYFNGEIARVRQLPNIGCTLRTESGLASQAKNGAFNGPVQGSASDIVLCALTRIVPWLRNDSIDAKIILTVHDSVVADVAEDDVDRYIATARAMMIEGFETKGVPLVADAEVGDAWGSLQKYGAPKKIAA